MANKYIKPDEIKKILDALANNGECEMSYGPYSNPELVQEVMLELAGVRLPGYSCKFDLEQQDEGMLVKFTISRDRIKGSPKKDPREDNKEVGLTPDQRADINSHNKQWLGNDTRKIEKTVSSSSEIVLHPDEAKQMADLFRKAQEKSIYTSPAYGYEGYGISEFSDIASLKTDLGYGEIQPTGGHATISPTVGVPISLPEQSDEVKEVLNHIEEAKKFDSENPEPNITGPSRGGK